MAILFANNCSTTLSVGITAGSTSIQVADSSAFPQPTGGDVIYITLEDPAGDIEIIRCSANDAINTFTVDTGGRGIDGTTAQAFNATETRVELRLVKTIMEAYLQKTGGTLTGNLNMSSNNVADAKLTGASTQMLAGEIVAVPLRGLAGASGNEIAVNTDGVTRATAGGAAILCTGDDIMAELDVSGTITFNSATVAVVVPSAVPFLVQDTDNSHNVQIVHDGTNPQLSCTNNEDFIFANSSIDLSLNQLKQAEFIDQSVTEQTVSSGTPSPGILTIDYSLGSYVNVQLTENISSIVINNAPANGAVGSMRIKFIQDPVTPRTISWTGYKFAKTPSHSTTVNAIDFVDLWTDDGGTTWYCAMDDNWVTQ